MATCINGVAILAAKRSESAPSADDVLVLHVFSPATSPSKSNPRALSALDGLTLDSPLYIGGRDSAPRKQTRALELRPEEGLTRTRHVDSGPCPLLLGFGLLDVQFADLNGSGAADRGEGNLGLHLDPSLF